MGKGWIAQRAAPGDPMEDMSTSDQFLIHQSFENELVAIAEKKSVMMALVDSTSMSNASVIVPVEEDVDVKWLATNRAVNVEIKGSAIADLTWEDFRDAVLKIPAEERKDCRWFLHETVLQYILNLKDANGNYIVRRPMEKMPGVIDLYPYHECHVMPQFTEIEDDTDKTVKKGHAG